MKQTNSAIRFLLAQYRSIFKKAYFKGLVSAAVLTTALASASTQAATNADGSLTTADFVTTASAAAGSLQNDTITKDSTLNLKDFSDKTTWFGLDFTIDKANVTINGAPGAALGVTNLTIQNGGKLTLKNDSTSASSLNGYFNEPKDTAMGNEGTLKLSSGSVEISAGSIGFNEVILQSGSTATVGGILEAHRNDSANNGLPDWYLYSNLSSLNSNGQTDANTQVSDSFVTLNHQSSMGVQNTMTVEGASKITLNGQLHADGKYATAFIRGNRSSGEITFKESADEKIPTLEVSNNAYGAIYAHEINLTQANLNVGSGATLIFDGDFIDDTSANQNTHLQSTMTLGDVSSTNQGTIVLGNTTNASNITVKGDATLTGKLINHSNIVVSGSSGNLTVDAAYFKKNAASVAEADKVGLFATGGKVTLSGSGTLTIAGTERLDLADISVVDFATPAAEAGKIYIADNGTIQGTNLTVSKALTNATGLSIKADSVVLGSNTYDNAAAFGFSSLTARNIEFNKTGAGAFKVQDNINYQSTVEVENPFTLAKDTVTIASTGEISSDLEIKSDAGEALRILAGHYTDNNDLTLSSGNLVIGGNSANTPGIEASLTLDGVLKLDNAAGANSITIEGNHTYSIPVDGFNATHPHLSGKAVLDLSDADLQITSNTANLSTIKVSGDSQLIINQDDLVEDILTRGSDGTNQGASIVIDSGKVTVNGSLSEGTKGIDVSKFSTGPSATYSDTVYFNNGGKLEADSIWLRASGVNQLNIGSGTFVSNTICLDQEDLVDPSDKTKGNKDFVIADGNLYVGSSLTSSNSTGNDIVLGDGSTGATMQLGWLTKNYNEWGEDLGTANTTSESGSVTHNIVLSGSGSSLTTLFGAWTVQNITLDGTETYFSVATNHVSGLNNTILDLPQTSLTGKKLNITSSGAQAKIFSESSATFEELAMSNGTLTVSGTMTITGKYTPADSSASPAVSESYGVNLTGGTIDLVGRSGYLTFGADAVKAITLNADGETVDIAAGTFAKNINLSDFATLKLDFDGLEFSAAQLQDLRKDLFANAKADGSAFDDGYINLGNAKIGNITVSGGAVDWNEVKHYKDITDIKTTDMSNATLINVDGSETVTANVGNIQVDGNTQSIALGDSVLSNANGGKGNGNFVFNTNNPSQAISFTVDKGAHVTLENGGNVADITLSSGTSAAPTILNIISSGEATTNIKKLGGDDNTLVNISGKTNADSVDVYDLQIDNALTAQNSVKVDGKLTSSAETAGNLLAASLTVKGETDYAGSLEISGKAEFQSKTYLSGAQNNFNGEKVTFVQGAELDRGLTTAKQIVLGDSQNAVSLEVVGGGQLIADTIQSASSSQAVNLVIGKEAGTENNEPVDSSAGYLTVNYLDLNGGSLKTDPDYGKAASLVAVKSFGDTDSIDSVRGNEAGNLNGQVIALRNSIVGIGISGSESDSAMQQLKSTFAQYFDTNGSLKDDQVGSIVYVAQALDVTNQNSKIIVDSTKSFTSYDQAVASDSSYQSKLTSNIYLGSNSVLAISDDASLNSFKTVNNANAQRAAIEFTYDGEASLYAEKGAKIVLVGDGFSTRENIYLFDDKNGDGIEIKENAVTVETLNGLMAFELATGEQKGGTLKLNLAAIDSSFNQASAPVKHSLISYAADDNNWEYQTETSYKEDRLHGSAANGVFTDNGKDFYTKVGDSTKPVEDNKDYVAIAYTDAQGKTAYHVYHDSYNYFLDSVVRNSITGIEAEQAARLSVYGGTAQAALSAGATTYDAISGRMGVGAQNGSITFADNGQGAGLWVSPIYKSHDSDGFGAQGPSYGVDMSMYGLSLGGDFTMANGLRVGGAFNLGSGDADGQGVGAGVSNDFDYVGFALYAGFSMDKLSLVGDISYTMVDNDVKANTAIEQISASMDSNSLSFGVTGQYALDINGLSVVPHAGLRYSSVDMDDYTVKGTGDIAYYSADSFNVFSIPVGVTVAKEIVAGSWTIKPSFDLTLTANMGDDSVGGTVAWAGIENLNTNVESEVIDSFTYGAALGLSAKSGNMSFGVGVNYTGASSADEYGIQANARFAF